MNSRPASCASSAFLKEWTLLQLASKSAAGRKNFRIMGVKVGNLPLFFSRRPAGCAALQLLFLLLFVPFVGFDDSLDQPVPDHVLLIQLDMGDPVDVLKDIQRFGQAALLILGQV